MEMKLAGPSSAFHENGVATVTGTETVQVDTLDAYMEGTDIEVGLIKVDIEGAEQDFLAGARKTIEKHKPVLLMSIYIIMQMISLISNQLLKAGIWDISSGFINRWIILFPEKYF